MPIRPVRFLILRTIKYLPHNKYGDRIFGLLRFMIVHKRRPNQDKFNDKLYKIKATDEILNPLRVFVSDKEFVKLYIKAQVGDKYNIPTLAILRSEEDIDKFSPQQDCAIKATHSSGRFMIYRSGETINREIMKGWLTQSYYSKTREANYKFLQPKIIVEPLLFQPETAVDYKVFCVHGVPKMIKVDFDRHINHLRKFYDVDWQPLPFSWNSPPTEKGVQKPEKLKEMLYLAGELGHELIKGIPKSGQM